MGFVEAWDDIHEPFYFFIFVSFFIMKIIKKNLLFLLMNPTWWKYEKGILFSIQLEEIMKQPNKPNQQQPQQQKYQNPQQKPQQPGQKPQNPLHQEKRK